MISDERREVAERLRWLASKQGTYKGVLVSDVLVPLRLLSVDNPGFIPRKSVARLADLIDPTCEYVPIGDGRFVCSGCGYTVNLDFDVPVTDETNMPSKHCPNCGARVVRTND